MSEGDRVVFETSYSESDDEPVEIDDAVYGDQDGTILRIPSDPNRAWNHFNERLLQFKKKDYLSVHNSVSPDETPTEKYRRLQVELSLLVEEVQNNDVVEDDFDADHLLHQICTLKDQLESVQINAHGDVYHSKQRELSLFIKDHLSTNKNKEETSLNYSLYYSPSISETEQSLLYSQLEKRINTIEILLGVKDKSSIPVEGLVERLNYLDDRVSNLDLEKMDHVTQKMKQVSEDLDDLFQRHDEIVPVKSDISEKIESLYDSSEIISEVAGQLPVVVKRLQTLKSLHESVPRKLSMIKHLSQNQSKIQQSLTEYGSILGNLEQNLAENMRTILSNIEIVESKMNQLLGDQ